MRTPEKEAKKDPKKIGDDKFNENLNLTQRKQLKALLKKMLPPVPSKGIIDIRFSFWFFRQWYIVFIFGKDTRETFKTLDKGYMDKSMSMIAKAIAYVVMGLLVLIVFLFFLYMVKTVLGIDILPDEHLQNIIFGKK